jgi:glycosyltransferase involved in cell wall biosynthesis
MYKQITPVVLTLNEEENIGRCLDQLTWATTVLVLDSGSIDNTESICSKYKNVNFVPHNFEDHAKQWTAAIDHASVKTDWVLTLDAHYILDRKFKQELERLNPEVGVNAFEADFVYLINGQPLNCSLYPPRVILARRNSLSFILDGYTQRQKIVGRVEKLNSKINHDDRKSDSQWRDSQTRSQKNY